MLTVNAMGAGVLDADIINNAIRAKCNKISALRYFYRIEVLTNIAGITKIKIFIGIIEKVVVFLNIVKSPFLDT